MTMISSPTSRSDTATLMLLSNTSHAGGAPASPWHGASDICTSDDSTQATGCSTYDGELASSVLMPLCVLTARACADSRTCAKSEADATSTAAPALPRG